MLLKFPENIRVKNLLPGIEGGSFAHALTWKKVNGVSRYNVYRSLVPYGNFDLIESPTIEGATDVNQSFLYDSEPYYRISTVNASSEEGPLSEPIADEDNLIYNTTNITMKLPTGSTPKFLPGVNPMPGDFMRRYQFSMIRRKLLWQLEDVGVKVWYFARKGIDPSNAENTRAYGRGAGAEYYSPIKILIRMISINETKLMNDYGFRRNRLPRSYTIWTPRIHDHGIMIDEKGRRYEVTAVTPHYFKGLNISHQDMDLIELPYNDDAYRNPQLNVEGQPL